MTKHQGTTLPSESPGTKASRMTARRIIGLGLAAMAGLALMAAQAVAEAPLGLRKLTVGAATSWFGPDVSPDDVRWRAPPTDGMKNAPIFGYAHRWKPGQPVPHAERVQMPLYRNFDSDDPKWWDQQLDEVLFTRPPLIFLIGRGCTRPDDPASFAGPGHMCPYKLRMMVDAVRRSAAEDAVRFALFVDTGATFALRRSFTRNGPERLDEARSSDRDPNTRFDLSEKPDSSGRTALWYFWEATVRPWFDTVPREMWYLFDDNGVKKPVIAFWGITHRFTGHRGNTTKLLAELKAKFVARYGVEPFFIVSTAWITGDPSLAQAPGLVGGVHDWFRPRFGEPKGGQAVSRWNGEKWQVSGTPNGISSLADWNGRQWGVTVPGFDCGPGCNVPPVPRQGGKSFERALDANRRAAINLIEGFNGPIEGTALYRSDNADWLSANAYLEILRRLNDPETLSLRLQAEGADGVTGTMQSSKNEFSSRATIVGKPDIGEWSIAFKNRDDGFKYGDVFLAQGSYTVYIRAQSRTENSNLKISIGSEAAIIKTIGRSPDATTPVIARAGTVTLPRGGYEIQTSVESGESEIDWIMIVKNR